MSEEYKELHGSSLLDEGEKEVLRMLSESFGAFIKLQELHPADQDEFMRAIHEAQNIVLARPALRPIGFDGKRGMS